MDNPIKIINDKASTLKEEDIDWIVQELMSHFSARIYSLSNYTYGSSQGVALAAFKEYASQTLSKGLNTFLFKSQHWRTGRSVGPYLSVCLTKLADNLKSNIDFVKKVSIPVCPGCKTLGLKEFLVQEGKLMRCPTCTKESDRLESCLRNSREEYEYRLHRVFSLHSRKGHRCPDCERFIPKSFIRGERASCPYDNCSWFGVYSELEPMPHPVAQSSGMTFSMNASSAKSNKVFEIGDFFDANEVNPDLRLEHRQKYIKELQIATDTLSTQRERLGKEPMITSFKKYFMYKSFEILLEQDPVGMMNYLIHGKSVGDRPIQSLIFQKYVQLIENNLPLEVNGEDGKVEVYSLLDPNLNLFLGQSEYQAHVRDSGFISNNTREIYSGIKCNGPCFIGYLCDVTDENGNSLLSEVDYYTFSTIKMSDKILPNTLVNVTHFRLPPHYEMFSLVLLQRVRKRIVTSINKRLQVS